MEVKRFFSTTMQDALRIVREEFGADAVILSNSKVEGGVEIVAALDYEEDWEQESVDVEIASRGEPSPSQLARMHAEWNKQKGKLKQSGLKNTKSQTLQSLMP
jgi:flagellar biosynthesis protein FlhF